MPARARLSLRLLLVAVLAPGTMTSWAAAYGRGEEESRLLAVLASAAPLAEREGACVRLHRIGSERAVPTLAALLPDPELSHAARHALEAMPHAAAGRALAEALVTTAGGVRLGIVASLASRREVAAVPGLAAILRDGSDPEGAEAAAHALGVIPDPSALAALESAWPGTSGPMRSAVVDALLGQGRRLLEAGESREAGRVFRSVHANERDPRVRVAADEGMIRAAGPLGLALVRAGLTGSVEPERAAALRVIEDLPQAGLGALLQELLPELAPAVQRSVLEGWVRRADPPPPGVVRPLLGSEAVETRLSAIHALGRVGAAEDVGTLLGLAVGAEPERRAARLALTTLRTAGVTDSLRRWAREGEGPGRIEAVRALGDRGDRVAAGELLELARSDEDALRLAALRSVSLVLEPAGAAALAGMVAAAPDPSRRGEAGRALALTLGRMQPEGGSPALVAVTEIFEGAVPEVRAALLTACGGVTAPEVRQMLRRALVAGDPAVRAAALGVVGATTDAGLLSDARELAVRGGDEAAREAGTRAAVRLITREGAGVAFAERLGFFRAVAGSAPNLAQRRVLLNALAAGRSREELALAAVWLDDEASMAEAAAAIVRLAPRVPEARPALAALRRVEALELLPATREEAAAAIEGVEARRNHFTSWSLLPTIDLNDRDPRELIDVVLPPEGPASGYADGARRALLGGWEPMRVAADARNPRQMRGGGPGVSGVAYAHTWLWSPEPRRVTMELQHDAAVKLWIGDREAARVEDPFEAGGKGAADAEVELAAGWNLVRVKLAQVARSWWFSLRVRAAEPGGEALFFVDASPADLRNPPQP